MAKKKQQERADKIEDDGSLKVYSKEELRKLSEMALRKVEESADFRDVIVNWAAGKPGRPIKWLPTGLPALDVALGGKGFAMGRIIEIWGPPQCGKTTLALHLIKRVQEMYGLMGVYLEAECKSVDVQKRAQQMGVDIDLFDSFQALRGETMYNLANFYASSPGYGVIVIDSISYIIPSKEYERDTDEAALRARLNSEELPKLAAEIARNDCLLILINQERTGMGVGFRTFRSKSGGKVVDYGIITDILMDFVRTEKMVGKNKKHDQYIYDIDGYRIGQQTKIQLLKNQLGKTYKPEIELSLNYASGWDAIGSTIDLGKECGAVEVNGAWFYYPNKEEALIKAQGKAQFMELMSHHPEYLKQIADHYIELAELAMVNSAIPAIEEENTSEEPLIFDE